MVEEGADPQLRRLITAHPLLFRGTMPAVPSHIPAGWYDLVDRLCTDIEVTLGPQSCAELEVFQINEKFGTLRFYYSLGEHCDVQVDLVSADEAMRLVGSGVANGDRLADNSAESQVRRHVAAACDASGTTCQRCGGRAELRNPDGWWVTLCDSDAAAPCCVAFGERLIRATYARSVWASWPGRGEIVVVLGF